MGSSAFDDQQGWYFSQILFHTFFVVTHPEQGQKPCVCNIIKLYIEQMWVAEPPRPISTSSHPPMNILMGGGSEQRPRGDI